MDGHAKWECGVCGQMHEGVAMVFGSQAPDPWVHAAQAERDAGELTADMCVLQIGGEWHYFLRGHIEIPILIAPGDVFSWSVWVSVSEESIQQVADHWEDLARASLPPVFGWLCNELPYEQSTSSIPTLVHSRDPGVVPFIQLDPSFDHPLVGEQGMGITLHRLAEINHLAGVEAP
ncbi:DUF2199 domain-containing protein [Micrococcaceae bacterium Sec5.7]